MYRWTAISHPVEDIGLEQGDKRLLCDRARIIFHGLRGFHSLVRLVEKRLFTDHRDAGSIPRGPYRGADIAFIRQLLHHVDASEDQGIAIARHERTYQGRHDGQPGIAIKQPG